MYFNFILQEYKYILVLGHIIYDFTKDQVSVLDYYSRIVDICKTEMFDNVSSLDYPYCRHSAVLKGTVLPDTDIPPREQFSLSCDKGYYLDGKR